MINIPYDFKGTVKYERYDKVVERIKKFNDYHSIGYDESGKFEMYVIRMGNRTKPTLLITASMHGTEWQGAQYSLNFMKQLQDNTFPDTNFRDFLLNNFYIVYIPVVNPWGYDITTPHAPASENRGRYTSTGADLNRDFGDFTQIESRNTKKVMDQYKPFAYLDLHLQGKNMPGNEGNNIIIGNGQNETNHVRDLWGDSLEEYTGETVTRWPGWANLKPLSRRYMRDQDNPYTPHTLSYILEITRPQEEDGELDAPLSDEKIYNIGVASLYLFFKTSIQYYMENFKTPEYESQLMYVRDLEGNEYHLQATTTHDIELNGNQSLSFTVLPSETNREFIGDLSEMWEVIDDKGVVHRIVYCKQKGKGNLKYNYTPEQKESFLSPVQTTQAINKKRELVKNMTVEVKAIPKFFDDMDNARIYEEYNEHMPAQRAFSRIFDGMPYQFIIVGQFDAVEWEGFGAGESRLETFKRALNRYKMEFRIEGSIVYLEHQIGRDTQFQYRYRLNASNIVKEIDAGEFWTYARGYGDYEGGEDEGWEHANIQMEYTSPLAKIVGKREAPPIKDGRIKKKSTMEQSLKELVDESLMISISTDIHDLRKQGYALAQPEVGDRVFIVDERIGLDEEIRITDISVTKDWKGSVIDLKLTVGSGNLSKRHQSNINTAAKELSDVLSGKKTFPYSVLDEAVKNATEALQNVQTELDFSGSGIIGRDKDNPNYLTLFSGRGIGVSDDGGNSFTEAIIAGIGINASAVVTGTMVADFIAGGTLVSLNGNLEFDMNNGNFDMKNAYFTLGNGAKIDFTDTGNRIKYSHYDDEDGFSRSSGFGVGKAYNDRFPFVFMGTNGTSGLAPIDDRYFSGFIANTTKRESVDGIGNSVVGYKFHVRDLPVSYTKGFEFDLNGNTNVLKGISNSSVNYVLGSSNSFFHRLYLRGMYTVGDFDIRNNGNTDIGFRFKTSSGLAFLGINGGSYEYNLGAKESWNHWNFGYINYLRGASSNSGVGSSDNPYRYGHFRELTVHEDFYNNSLREYKEDINDLPLDMALEFVKNNKVKTFKYEDGKTKNVGLIRNELVIDDEGLVANDTAIKPFSVLYINQRVTKNLLERVEQLEARINE